MCCDTLLKQLWPSDPKSNYAVDYGYHSYLGTFSENTRASHAVISYVQIGYFLVSSHCSGCIIKMGRRLQLVCPTVHSVPSPVRQSPNLDL